MTQVHFAFEVAYRVSCSICGTRSASEYYRMSQGCEFPHPLLPEGWRVLDGQLICEQHEVRVTARADVGCVVMPLNQLAKL